MDEFVTRKKSLEEEIKLCQWMFTFEHRIEMKNKIQKYLNQVQKDMVNFLR